MNNTQGAIKGFTIAKQIFRRINFIDECSLFF